MLKRLEAISPVAVILTALTIVYALLALGLGWGLNIDALVRHATTQSAMVPATALAFLLTGLALLAGLSGFRRLAHAFSVLVLVLILVITVGQILEVTEPTGLFFAQLGATEHMAHVTEFGFVLAVFALNRFLAGSFFAVDAIAIFGVSGALAITVLNLTATTSVIGLDFLAGMSLQTSILFALLFIALCMISVDRRSD